MQPFQYELRCPAAKHNSITRTAAGARNLYAAITLRFAAPRAHSCSHYIAFCSIRWLTRMYLRTWQQNMTTIMQPAHCDLQSQIPKHRVTTHTWTTARYVMYCCVMCRFVMYCYVMYCCGLYSGVMYCCVMYCFVLLCDLLLCNML